MVDKLKFSCNISTMFLEEDEMVDRYAAAKKYGFKAVECQFPYDYSPEFIRSVKAATGMHHDFLNSYPGEIDDGDFGLACNPLREVEFMNSLSKTIDYATTLQCPKIRILCGIPDLVHFNMEESFTVLKNNLKSAAGVLQEHNLIGLIEPLCPDIKEGYILSSFEKAREIVEDINSPNIKILLDIFHLHMLHGKDNILSLIRTYYPYSGHIQVSQAPTRYELNYPGDIDYKAVLQLLSELGHDDYIGLEYMSSGSTVDSLKWMQEFGCKL